MRALSGSRARDPRTGPFTLAQGLGPPSDFLWSPGGRLTTQSGEPVSTADRSGQATLYYTAYEHALYPLWTGRKWTGAELPVARGSNSTRQLELSLGGVASGSVYDVFLRGRELALGPAWSSATARGDAAAIARTLGRWTLAADPRNLYLGTIYGSGSGTIEDSVTKRYLWNAYNRVPRHLVVTDTTDSWTYSTQTWRQVRATASNKVELVLGLTGSLVRARAYGLCSSDQAAWFGSGVGVDSTSTNSAQTFAAVIIYANDLHNSLGTYAGYPGIGYHYLAWLEIGYTGGTQTHWGDAGQPAQTGLTAEVEM